MVTWEEERKKQRDDEWKELKKIISRLYKNGMEIFLLSCQEIQCHLLI